MRDVIQGGWRPTTIETPRLVLRALSEDDVDSVFAYASNPNVTRHTLWDFHRSREDARTFVTEAIARYVEKAPDPVAICLKSDPKFVIGTISCRWVNRTNRCMEMGYALGEPHWGQGIVVEAARALLDFVFSAYQVERIQAHTFADNTASAKVLEKLGMTYEGTFRSALFHRGRFWCLKMFSMLRSEWPLKRAPRDHRA